MSWNIKEGYRWLFRAGCSQGYVTAKKLLKDLLRQPFKVARSRTDGPMSGANIVEDVCVMPVLVIEDQNCVIAVEHLGQRSKQHAILTPEGIVQYLPSQLQMCPAEQMDTTRRSMSDAKVWDLKYYLNRQASTADGMFRLFTGNPARSQNRGGRL